MALPIARYDVSGSCPRLSFGSFLPPTSLVVCDIFRVVSSPKHIVIVIARFHSDHTKRVGGRRKILWQSQPCSCWLVIDPSPCWRQTIFTVTLYLVTMMRISPSVLAFARSSSSVSYGSLALRMMGTAPAVKPANPEFSSGPCKKRPGYDIAKLDKRILGRSHRSKIGKERLALAIDETKRILGVPDDYLVGIVPASDTGAYEMAMWNVLGARDVDICHWESFGKGWFGDAVSHLKLRDTVNVNEHTADYGYLPDLSKTNPENDICFTFNGTTSGVRVPDGCGWISDSRTGLTLCDATSACFAMDMPWKKLDITTYSWQKVLGGEGGHGVLILSPKAVARLESYVPENRPLPKIFRMTKKGKVDTSIFKGSTINTPSMICVEDYIDALQWADSIGGVAGLKKISMNNLAVVEAFVEKNDWINFLAKDPATRSSTSVCLTMDLTADQIKKFVSMLEREDVALDIGGYRDAPPSIRIWCGSTVETADVEKLMPWLAWAFEEAKKA